jgi:hypothetical protein
LDITNVIWLDVLIVVIIIIISLFLNPNIPKNTKIIKHGNLCKTYINSPAKETQISEKSTTHNNQLIQFVNRFVVTVSDGKHEIKRMCNVTVKLINDEKPELVTNAGMTLDYGHSALVSPLVLEARDGDNDNDNLYIILRQLPVKGLLQFCPNPSSLPLTHHCRDLKVS